MAASLQGAKHNGSDSSLCTWRCWGAARGSWQPLRGHTNLWRASDTGPGGLWLTVGSSGEGVGSVSSPGHGSPQMTSCPGSPLAPCSGKSSPGGDLGLERVSGANPPTLSRASSIAAAALGCKAELSAAPPCPLPWHRHPPVLAAGGPGWPLLLCGEFGPGEGAGARRWRILPGTGGFRHGEWGGFRRGAGWGHCACRVEQPGCRCSQRHTGKLVCPCMLFLSPGQAMALAPCHPLPALSPTATPSPGSSPLQSCPLVLHCILCHPTGDSRGVPISRPPPSKGS